MLPNLVTRQLLRQRSLMRHLFLLAATPFVARAQATPTWRLQLDHAIRPAEGSVGSIGDVAYLAVTRGGEVYVAERKIPRVTRYDAAGTFAGIVMRDGAGPGETRDPAIALYGDTLLIYDQSLTRVTRLSPSGKVISEVHMDAHSSGGQVSANRDGSFIVNFGWTRDGYNHNRLRVSPAGHVDTMMWNAAIGDNQFAIWSAPNVGILKGGAFSAAFDGAIDPAGHVVVGGTRQSRWFVLSGKDTIERVILADRPVTIPRARRDSAWDAMVARFKSTPMAAVLTKETFPTTLPAWVSLDINPRGEWWIGRPGMDGKLASWDIIDHGKIVGHAVLPTPIAGTFAAHLEGSTAFGNDFLAILHEDDNGLPWIGVYRIVRGK
jgi:hypothetical protein